MIRFSHIIIFLIAASQAKAELCKEPAFVTKNLDLSMLDLDVCDAKNEKPLIDSVESGVDFFIKLQKIESYNNKHFFGELNQVELEKIAISDGTAPARTTATALSAPVGGLGYIPVAQLSASMDKEINKKKEEILKEMDKNFRPLKSALLSIRQPS